MPHRRTIAVLLMTFAGLAGRLSSLLSSVVVGYFLTQPEIGTYAVALGIMGFTAMLRGGGSGHYLPTIRAEDYDEDAGRVFWWGLAFLAVSALTTWTTAAAIPHLKSITPPPGLETALWVLGARQVVLAFQQIGRMRLASRLEFRELAKLDIVNAVVRLVLTAMLAWRGAGVLALVIPYAVSPVIEVAYFTARGDMSKVRYRWIGSTLPAMARQMAWPLVIAVLVSLNSQVSFLIVKLVVPLATVGVFYFAFQLAAQPATLLSTGLSSVFSAHFARDRGEQRLEAQAMRSAFAGAMLFVPIVMFGVAATFPSAQRLVWGGKWDAAVVPVMLLAASAAWSTSLGLLTGPMSGLRHFRPVAGFEALKAIGVLGGAAAGSLTIWLTARFGVELPEWMEDEATLIAGSTSLAVTLASVGQLVWLMPRYGLTRTETIRTIFHGPLLAATIALGAWSIGSSLTATLGLHGGRTASAVQLACTSGAYLLTSAIAIRFMAESTVHTTVQSLPQPLRTIAARFLRI